MCNSQINNAQTLCILSLEENMNIKHIVCKTLLDLIIVLQRYPGSNPQNLCISPLGGQGTLQTWLNLKVFRRGDYPSGINLITYILNDKNFPNCIYRVAWWQKQGQQDAKFLTWIWKENNELQKLSNAFRRNTTI